MGSDLPAYIFAGICRREFILCTVTTTDLLFNTMLQIRERENKTCQVKIITHLTRISNDIKIKT